MNTTPQKINLKPAEQILDGRQLNDLIQKAEAEKEKKQADKKDLPAKLVPVEKDRSGEPLGGEGGGEGGMMMGVTPGTGKADDTKKAPLPVTPWGRYIKVLLSSPEFEFIN